jgi:hypothetical protein
MTRSNVLTHLRSHLWLLFVTFLLSIVFWSKNGYTKDAKILRLTDSSTATVPISGRGTVLSFPTKPTKVILGKANSFGIEYCENDLAISPLNAGARSHLYVYLYGRRFSFDLISSMGDGDAVILVRDAKEPDMKGKR